MCRQRRARAYVRAHDQRVDDAGRGAGISQSFVASWNHLRERVRRTAEETRQLRHLLDVVSSVSTDALRIRAECRVDLVAAYVLAIGGRDSEMLRDGLEPVSRQFARRKVVAPYRIESVYQLSTWRDESYASPVVGVTGSNATSRCALAQSRGPDSAE